MANTRVVKGKVLGANVEQKEGNRVQIRIDEVTAGDDSVRFPSSVDAQTDANGEFRVPLLVNQQYTAALPDGSEKTFFVPAGEGEVDLSDLVGAIAASLTEAYRFEAFVSSNLERLVKPILDDAAANVTAGAAGKSAVPLTGGPSAILGNDGDVGIDPNTGFVYKKASGLWGEPIGSIKGPPGDLGDPGAPGEDGTPGDPGAPGDSAYVHFGFAEEGDGAGFSSQASENTIYVSFTATDTPDYPPQELFTTWALFRGAPGEDARGEPGNSAYVFVRYAENSTGGGVSATPNEATSYIAVLSTSSSVEPLSSAFDGLWVPYIRDAGSGAALPPLHVKLSEVTSPTFALSMEAGRAHIITRDAAKTVELTNRSDAGRADVTFVVPRVGTIHPLTINPSQTLELTQRRGYADNYLFKSFMGSVYGRGALLDFPYDPVTTYWVDGGGVAYVFEAANNPLNNRIANADHLTLNEGTLRTPYGLDLTKLQYAYSDVYGSIDFNQPFWAHIVFDNLEALKLDAGRPFAFVTRGTGSAHLALSVSSNGILQVYVYTTTVGAGINATIGNFETTLVIGGSLVTPKSLIISRDGAGRFDLRCLTTGDGLKNQVTGVRSESGYYPNNDSNLVAQFPAMGVSFGGVARNTARLSSSPAYLRYFRVVQESYSAVRAVASNNFASDWIAAIDPNGPQLARL